MQYTFLELRIITLFSSKEYEECLFLLEEMYKNILEDKDINKLNKNKTIWTYYYYKANILAKQSKDKISLSIILKCFKYLKYKDSEDTDYKRSLNLLGLIYKRLNHNKQAIKVYYNLLKLTKDKQQRMLLLYNIYELENNKEIKLKDIKNNYKIKYNSLIEEDMKICNYF